MSEKSKKPETERQAYDETVAKWDVGEEFKKTNCDECPLCAFYSPTDDANDRECEACILGPGEVACEATEVVEAAEFLGVPHFKNGDYHEGWNTAAMRLVLQKVLPEVERREKVLKEREAEKAEAKKLKQAESKAKKEKERIVWDRKKTYIRWESSGTYWVLSQRPDGLWGFVSDSGTWSCVSERDPQGCIDDTNWPISVHPTHTAALQYILDQEASKREPKPWKEYRHGDKVVYDPDKYYVHWNPHFDDFGGPHIVPDEDTVELKLFSPTPYYIHGHSRKEIIARLLDATGNPIIYECPNPLAAIQCMEMIVREKERAGK